MVFFRPPRLPTGGYELATALDFAGSRWALNATTDGIADAVAEGWEPIGDESNPYSSTFNGNGHTITGLCINRSDTKSVGLFGAMWRSGTIRNVGLVDVYVHSGYVQSNSFVGGLVGWNHGGTITSSYVTGTVYVTGTLISSADIQSAGGLVGHNLGSITSSYATGTVTSTDSVGGLVGSNTGPITSSYATGSVDGNNYVGGLVGQSAGDITSSYATGDVTGNRDVGGLVGLEGGSSTITSSYYSGIAVVLQGGDAVPPNAYARSIVELARVPTADAPGIFADWALDAAGNAYTLDDNRIVWDFGTATQYPVLCPVDANGDTHFTSAEFGMQPRDTGIAGAHVYFAQSEFTVGEEDGAVEVSVVMLNAPTDAVTVTVEYSDGTAMSPDDYASDSGMVDLSFDASSAVDLLTTATFTITIIDDSLREGTETIALSFSALSGVALAVPSTATVLILDDESRGAYDTDGDGLIEVHTVEQLNAIRHDLNGNGEIDDTTSSDPSVDGSKAAAYVSAFHGVCPSDDISYGGYELAAALDFAGTRWALNATTDGITDAVAEGWEPIGYSGNPYLNTFEGNGHTITGLCINRSDTESVGLFAFMWRSGTIRNVGLVDVYVHSGYVQGNSLVGGLVGWNHGGTITSSYVTGTVYVTGTLTNSADIQSAGGLVGHNLGSITSSYATGSVSGIGAVGGLVGRNLRGTIASSYATGDVTGTEEFVGGLVGFASGGKITSSYATGAVMSTDSAVGGLVGDNNGDITSSYATGDVSGHDRVGGLVGQNVNNITSSYATGDVTGNSNVGGLVGENFSGGTITSSYYNLAAVVTRNGDAVEPNDYARSAVELASVPTADAPGIFEKWALDAAGKKKDINGTAYTLDDDRIVWDFGTGRQYPVLCPVDANEDGIFTSAEFGMQPRDIAGTYVYFSQPEFVVGEEDGTAAVSVVMLNAADAVTLTVEYSDGTAMSPDDYASDSGMVDLSFDASSAVDFLTTATFTIPIIDDSLRENTETIALSLDIDTLPSGVTLVGSSASTVFIVDDELRGAYDADGDGLIDVHDLEQLNAIRYDLNGDGEIDDLTSNDPAVARQQGGGLCVCLSWSLSA